MARKSPTFFLVEVQKAERSVRENLGKDRQETKGQQREKTDQFQFS
jgi:hypothetical protein